MKKLVTIAIGLIFAQATLAQSFQRSGQPQGVPYSSFVCQQPRQKRLTTFLNVLGSVLSNAQGLSSSRRFNNGVQVGLMVVNAGQELQASRASPMLVCYAAAPTNY